MEEIYVGYRVITRLIRNVYVDGQLAVGLVGEQRDPVYTTLLDRIEVNRRVKAMFESIASRIRLRRSVRFRNAAPFVK